MIQALLDSDTDRRVLNRRYLESEADRVARLDALEVQGRQLGEAEAERNELRAEVSALHRRWREARRTGRRGWSSSRRRGGDWARWRHSGTTCGRRPPPCASIWRGVKRTGRRGWRPSRRRGGGWARWRQRNDLGRGQRPARAPGEERGGQGGTAGDHRSARTAAGGGGDAAERPAARGRVAAAPNPACHDPSSKPAGPDQLIQATRAYKLLRRLGRWNSVDSSSPLIEQRKRCASTSTAPVSVKQRKRNRVFVPV